MQRSIGKGVVPVRGFSLIEVLIAIVILSVGLLALAALQARLTRASADAKAQSTALTLAEQRFERFRSFVDINAYQQIGQAADLVDEAGLTSTGSGTTFTRQTAVTRYVFVRDVNGDGDDTDPEDRKFVVEANNTGTPEAREYKLVEVEVEWSNAENQSNSVKLANIISSSTPSDSALTVRAPGDALSGPQVRIYPPSDVGIIPIAIGGGRAAASSNPQPELTNSGASTLTQFNVQTYLQDQANPLLQRRVDNALINCTCRLGSLSTAAAPAFEPTYWDGNRYTSPKEIVGKRVGTLTTSFQNNSEEFQRALCTSCCRDHHDRSNSIVRYDPFRPSSDYDSGNHNHYPPGYDPDPDNNPSTPPPDFLPVTGGQEYGEVCRFVRVDGMFRVAVDTRLENMTILQAGPGATPVLDGNAVATYAGFAKKYVEGAWGGLGTWAGADSFSENQTPPYPDLLQNCDADNNCTPSSLATDSTRPTIPGSDPPAASTLSISDMLDVAKNLRPDPDPLPRESIYWLQARGLYIDFLSDEARFALNCIGDTSDECTPFRTRTVLEIMPFIAVNLTGLADWDSEPAGIVSVVSEGINNAGYTRGKVVGQGAPPDGIPYADAFAIAFRGNTGLVDREATDPNDLSENLTDSEQFVSTGTPAPPFFVQVVDSSNNRNTFNERQLQISVTAPTVSPSSCASQPNPNGDTYRCYYNDTTLTVTLRFGNYNVPSCPSTGTGQDRVTYTYDAANDVCVSPGGATTAPTVTDFKLCSVDNRPPASTISVASPSDSGRTRETTDVTITLNSLNAPDRLTNRTLPATFVSQSQTCP